MATYVRSDVGTSCCNCRRVAKELVVSESCSVVALLSLVVNLLLCGCLNVSKRFAVVVEEMQRNSWWQSRCFEVALLSEVDDSFW